MRRWFQIWRLFFHCFFFIISSSFGTSGRLSFMIVAFPMYLQLHVCLSTVKSSVFICNRLRYATACFILLCMLKNTSQHDILSLILSMPNFRRHLSSAFFISTNSLGKAFICKVDRLNVKQSRSRWDGSLSRLIWIYAVCKSLLLSPVAVKDFIIEHRDS